MTPTALRTPQAFEWESDRAVEVVVVVVTGIPKIPPVVIVDTSVDVVEAVVEA
jgi:hypothetical protein